MGFVDEFKRWLDETPQKKEFREFWEDKNKCIKEGQVADYWKDWAFESDYRVYQLDARIKELGETVSSQTRCVEHFFKEIDQLRGQIIDMEGGK